MAKFSKSLSLLDLSTLEYINSGVSFQGIIKDYFPKWEGWNLIDSGITPSEDCVKNFYRDYFWRPLKGDLIFNQEIASLILIFSVLSGKKKAICKIQRILNMEPSGVIDNMTLMAINYANPKLLFLELYSEFSELYITDNNISNLKKLLPVYHYYLGVNRHL